MIRAQRITIIDYDVPDTIEAEIRFTRDLERLRCGCDEYPVRLSYFEGISSAPVEEPCADIVVAATWKPVLANDSADNHERTSSTSPNVARIATSPRSCGNTCPPQEAARQQALFKEVMALTQE